MTESNDLVESLLATRLELLRAADAVPAQSRRTPFVGHWDLMGVLAHLIGWDYANLQALDALRRDETPEFYNHYDPGWASYNEQLVERHGTEDWTALRAAIERSQAAVEGALRLLTPEELSKDYQVPKRRRPLTIAAILRAAVKDEQEHAEQIRTFVARL